MNNLTERNNAATALLLHHPEWRLEASFREIYPDISNVYDIREVVYVLNKNSEIARKVDSHWADLMDVQMDIRQFCSNLAKETQNGLTWKRFIESGLSRGAAAIVNTIKRAVMSLADLLSHETFGSKPPDKQSVRDDRSRAKAKPSPAPSSSHSI